MKDEGSKKVRAYLLRNANLNVMDDIQDWYLRAEAQRMGGGEGFTDDKKFQETDTMIMNMNTISKDTFADEYLHKLQRGRFDL